jgi:septum formation protein
MASANAGGLREDLSMSKRKLILASASPRRQFLLREIGFEFIVDPPHIDESFPIDMSIQQVPSYLAEKKARALLPKIEDEVVLASDTVVILGDKILNKPADRAEAIQMLTDLSGHTHTVITAVCLLSKGKCDLFEDKTDVTFRKLSLTDVEFYIDTYKPYDKAGAYGAQDCLPPDFNPCSGEEINFLRSLNKLPLIEKTISHAKHGKEIVVIEKITGSYFTVMGLPIHKVYEHLQVF